MIKKKMKQIDVNKDIWDQLCTLREKLKYKKWSATIGWLLNQVSNGETVPDSQEPNPEKNLQDLIGERTWRRIDKMQTDHGFDSFSRLLDHFVDCHNVLQQESSHKKLEGKEVLEEIYDHIQQLKLSQEPATRVASEISAVDMTQGESQNHIDDTTEKQEWLCCPICWNAIPLLVKDSLQKPEKGFVFKEIDGRIERRFLGVTNEFQPLEMRQVSEIIVEDSMAIGTLRHLNKTLYDDIQKTLAHANFLFGGR